VFWQIESGLSLERKREIEIEKKRKRKGRKRAGSRGRSEFKYTISECPIALANATLFGAKLFMG